MTTRPTDEEIRNFTNAQLKSIMHHGGEYEAMTFELARSWLAERQAAKDGVTTNEREAFEKWIISLGPLSLERSSHTGEYIDSWVEIEFEAWQARAKLYRTHIASVSDALNFLEEWALSGNTLHGDDIQRLHETVERIAPVAQAVRVPDAKEPMTAQDELYADGWNACREAMLSDSPQPQQVMPDGFQWMDGIPVHPWDKEWFIAELDNGDRVVLKALPDEYTYDFKTADETYLAKRRIKRWMQFPDSEFIAAPAYNGKKEGAIRPNDTMMPFVMFDAMLSAAPTPPKSASVPVERLEALLDNLKSVPVNQEWIYGALAELIAEYKAETTSKGE